MPYLVRKIVGEVLPYYEGNGYFASELIGEMGVEDYIEIYGFVAYTQNFSKVVEATSIPIPTSFGLKNKTQFTEYYISYPL